MREYLTKRDGYWRFVRRVPKEFADFVKQPSVQLSTGIRVTDDPRAIAASKKATEINGAVERHWRDLANGIDSAKVRNEYDLAVRAAKRFGFSAPIDDPAQPPMPQVLARIERLEAILQDQAVSHDDKRAAVLAAYDAAPRPAITFRECAEQYIEAHKAGWKNRKHVGQWQSTLATYAYPVIGSLPVKAIDGNGTGTGLIMKILEPIWHTKVETAARVRGRIERVLDWAKTKDFRQGENPARWKGHLDNLLPAKNSVAPTRHHPAMPYSEMPDFMKKLRAMPDTAAVAALAFTVLNAGRTDEVRLAKRSEIDLKTRMWTIPAERMKGKKEHRVPLSDAAMAIIKALPNSGDYLFASVRKKGNPIGATAMLDLLEKMGLRDQVVTHGFRSTFSDWANETTRHDKHVIEMALAHTVGTAVERVYRRGDLLAKRVALMDDWARFCNSSC
jgi:integrase